MLVTYDNIRKGCEVIIMHICKEKTVHIAKTFATHIATRVVRRVVGVFLSHTSEECSTHIA